MADVQSGGGWSRRSLRKPLLLIAASSLTAAGAGIASIFEGVAYVHAHYPGATAVVVASVLGMLANTMVAAGIVWVALTLGRRD